MKVIGSRLDAVKIIALDRHRDERGYFMEIYNRDSFLALGIHDVFVQDNCSFSERKGTVRGLHFQKAAFAQSKLIRCVRGSFYDIAVDVRKGSPTYGKAAVVPLSEDDDQLVYIPRGFAHGVAIREDGSAYTYKVDGLYAADPAQNGGLSCRYDSAELNWDELLPGTDLTLSARDISGVADTLEALDTDFIYGVNC